MMDFESFLIKPMQRVTRYPLLIKELMKHTPITHPDHVYISLALQELHKLLHQTNERKRSLENAVRVIDIQRRMVWTGQKMTLLIQNRELIYEVVFSGKIAKEFTGPVKVDLSKKLRILVFTDVLFVIKDKKHTIGSERYIEKCRMPLHDCLVWPLNLDDIDIQNSNDIKEKSKNVHGFCIVIPDITRVLVFTEKESEKVEWMRKLGESVGKRGSILMRQTHRDKTHLRRSKSTGELSQMVSLIKPVLNTPKKFTSTLPPVEPSTPTQLGSSSPQISATKEPRITNASKLSKVTVTNSTPQQTPPQPSASPQLATPPPLPRAVPTIQPRAASATSPAGSKERPPPITRAQRVYFHSTGTAIPHTTAAPESLTSSISEQSISYLSDASDSETTSPRSKSPTPENVAHLTYPGIHPRKSPRDGKGGKNVVVLDQKHIDPKKSTRRANTVFSLFA